MNSEHQNDDDQDFMSMFIGLVGVIAFSCLVFVLIIWWLK
mgnify:CR=1 FL=1